MTPPTWLYWPAAAGGGGTPWSPSELVSTGNLRAWFRADGDSVFSESTGGSLVTVDGDVVRRWEDESGTFTSHPINTSSSGAPVLRTGVLNGLPVVEFSGTRGFHRGATPIYANSPTSVSLFALARRSGGNGTVLDVDNYKPRLVFEASGNRPYVNIFNMLGVYSDTSRFSPAWNTDLDSWSIMSAKLDFEGDSTVFRRNGGSQQFSVATNFNASTIGSSAKNVTIGARYAETTDVLQGDIAEIVVTTNDVSVEHRNRIEGYLAWKWGLEGNLPSGHPYENAAPTTS